MKFKGISVETVVLTLILAVMMMPGASATLSSPSSVQVSSGNSFFQNYDGKVVILEWTADNFDSSQVTVEPEEINPYIEGQVTEPVTLEIVSKTSQAKFDIRQGGRPDLKGNDYLINTWEWGTLSAPSQEDRKATYKEWAMSACDDVNGDGQTSWYINEYYTGWLNDKLNAQVSCDSFSSDIIAQIGEIESTPTEVMGATFRLEAGSFSEEKTITNSYTGSDDSGKSATFSNFAKINFQGGLESGYNFPEPNDELVAFSNRFDPNYRIIYDQNVENKYPDILANADSTSNLKDILLEDSSNPHDEAYYESLYNSQIRDLTNEYSQSEFYSENIQFSGSDLGSGTLTIESDQRVGSYPAFQVIVKADSVGYYIPDATPEITDVQSPGNLLEGTTGNIEVTVQNTGSGEGDFSARVTSCSSGFTGSDSSVGIDLQPGQSTTVDLPVSFNSGNYDSKTISGSCDIEVENLRDNQETVSSTAELTGEQSNECEPGKQYTEIKDLDGDGDNDYQILECGSSGLKKSEVGQCTGDDERAVKQSDGSYECVKEQTPETPDDNTGDPVDTSPKEGDSSQACLINQDWIDTNPTDDKDPRLKIGCVAQSTLQKAMFVIVLVGGLLGSGAGYMLGSYVDGERNIQGKNRYLRQRSVSRVERSRNSSLSQEQIIGAVAGGLVGLGVGWYLGIWGTVGVISLLVVIKYLVPGY